MVEAGFPALAAGWQLMGWAPISPICVIPSTCASDDLCRRMVSAAGILALPGTMFMPEGDADGATQLRIAFANLDREGRSRGFSRGVQRPALLILPLKPLRRMDGRS
jgi:aspartate/methionine/tyrosine aminotransferase